MACRTFVGASKSRDYNSLGVMDERNDNAIGIIEFIRYTITNVRNQLVEEQSMNNQYNDDHKHDMNNYQDDLDLVKQSISNIVTL